MVICDEIRPNFIISNTPWKLIIFAVLSRQNYTTQANLNHTLTKCSFLTMHWYLIYSSVSKCGEVFRKTNTHFSQRSARLPGRFVGTTIPLLMHKQHHAQITLSPRAQPTEAGLCVAHQTALWYNPLMSASHLSLCYIRPCLEHMILHSLPYKNG